VEKDIKFSLYAFKFIAVDNCNSDQCNSGMFKLRFDCSKVQHHPSLYGWKQGLHSVSTPRSLQSRDSIIIFLGGAYIDNLACSFFDKRNYCNLLTS
jgi:hypothetical protein